MIASAIQSSYCGMANANNNLPSVGGNSPARRMLFGKPDTEKLKHQYEEMHRVETQRAKEKWGFDFEEETPVENNSKYEWEQVPTTTIPKLYHPAISPAVCEAECGALPAPAAAQAAQPPSAEVVPKAPSPPPQPLSSSPPAKQSLITDFMPLKRRSTSAASSSATSSKLQRRESSEQAASSATSHCLETGPGADP